MQSFGYQGHSSLVSVGLSGLPHMEFTLVKIWHMGSFKYSAGKADSTPWTGAARTLVRGVYRKGVPPARPTSWN